MKCEIEPGSMLGYDIAGRGWPVIWLHAFPFDRSMWRAQIEGLKDQGRMIAIDQRGFGCSDGFKDKPSIDQMADDVALFMEKLPVPQPAIVIGLSMGGYVALAFARRHGNLLAGLVLADTRAEPDGPEAKAARDQLIDVAQSRPATDVIDQLMPRMLSDQTRANKPEVMTEVRRIAGGQKPSAIANALRAMRDRPDARAELGQIHVPTLVLVGEHDVPTPPAASDALAAAIPGSRLEIIAGAGHLSNFEQPAEFNRVVSTFLESLPVRR